MTRCAGGCGRELEPEDMIEVGGALVCEPCQAAAAKAGERRDSIDAAWAAVEAALPKGWLIEGLIQFPIGNWEATAEPARDDRWAPAEDALAQAEGPTPVAALRALAAKLAEDG